MKVWTTKYALTKGIIEADARQLSKGAVCVLQVHCGLPSDWFYAGEWCASKEESIAKAEEMRKKAN